MKEGKACKLLRELPFVQLAYDLYTRVAWCKVIQIVNNIEMYVFIF